MAVTQVKQFEQPFNERYNLSWDDITVAGKNFFVKKPFYWKNIFLKQFQWYKTALIHSH